MASTITPSLRPTFPFTITNEVEYEDSKDRLEIAARSGDITYLDNMEERYEGIEYKQIIVKLALESGHLEFFKRYLMLSRMLLILNANISDGFWECYLGPFLDTLNARAPDHIRYQATEFIFEKLFPNLPSADEVGRVKNVMYMNYPFKLPSRRYTIWSLQDYKTLHNDHDGQRCLSRAMLGSLLDISQYLVTKFGITSTLQDLSSAVEMFDPRVYRFVLDHLDPNIDKNHLPIQCQDIHRPSDLDLMYRLYGALHALSYRSNERIIEFLQNYPECLRKIPSIIQWLRELKAPGSTLTDEFVVGAKMTDWFQFFEMEEVSAMLDLLENLSLQLGPIDVAEPIDFRSQSLRDRLSPNKRFIAHELNCDGHDGRDNGTADYDEQFLSSDITRCANHRLKGDDCSVSDHKSNQPTDEVIEQQADEEQISNSVNTAQGERIPDGLEQLTDEWSCPYENEFADEAENENFLVFEDPEVFPDDDSHLYDPMANGYFTEEDDADYPEYSDYFPNNLGQ